MEIIHDSAVSTLWFLLLYFMISFLFAQTIVWMVLGQTSSPTCLLLPCCCGRGNFWSSKFDLRAAFFEVHISNFPCNICTKLNNRDNYFNILQLEIKIFNKSFSISDCIVGTSCSPELYFCPHNRVQPVLSHNRGQGNRSIAGRSSFVYLITWLCHQLGLA